MVIKGTENLSTERVHYELQRGAKFVVYEYCISVVFLSFKEDSEIHFVTVDQNRFLTGIKYSLITIIAGWWGIPWGPVYSIYALITNCRGGKDVTSSITGSLHKAHSELDGDIVPETV